MNQALPTDLLLLQAMMAITSPAVCTAAPPVTRKEVQANGDKIAALDKAEAKRQRKADKRKPK